jgi:hypothetical protein
MTRILTKRILTKRGLIAAVVMAVAALFASVTPASAATGPYGFTILHADAGNIAHHCEFLGSGLDEYHNGTAAYVCVDIDTSGTDTGYRATGAIEAWCYAEYDGTGFYTPCPSIYVHGFFANASSGAANFSWSCDGNCLSTGRNIIYSTSINYTNANCTSNAVNDVWTALTGNTTISLFTSSGSFVTYSIAAYGANDGTGYSSGHYWVCP